LEFASCLRQVCPHYRKTTLHDERIQARTQSIVNRPENVVWINRNGYPVCPWIFVFYSLRVQYPWYLYPWGMKGVEGNKHQDAKKLESPAAHTMEG